MKQIIGNVLLLLLLFMSNKANAQKTQSSYDVIVYGATSGGVIAAYSAAKMGKSVLLIEPGKHVGGLTSGWEIGLPPEKWSSLMYGLWPDGGLKNGKEATHCGRDRHQAAAD